MFQFRPCGTCWTSATGWTCGTGGTYPTRPTSPTSPTRPTRSPLHSRIAGLHEQLPVPALVLPARSQGAVVVVNDLDHVPVIGRHAVLHHVRTNAIQGHHPAIRA